MRCQGIIFVQDNRRRLAPQHMDHVATPIDDPYFTGVWLISPPPFQDGDPARLLVRVARLLLHLAPHSGPSYAALHSRVVEGEPGCLAGGMLPASSCPLGALQAVT